MEGLSRDEKFLLQDVMFNEKKKGEDIDNIRTQLKELYKKLQVQKQVNKQQNSTKKDAFKITPKQKEILNKIVSRGIGEGVQRIHKRLLKIYENEKKRNFKGECIFSEFDPELRPATLQPDGKSRIVHGQCLGLNGSRSKPSTYRCAVPSRRAIALFLMGLPRYQQDRQPRHKATGGVRTAPKDSLRPVLPTKPLGMVFVDSMKMPASLNYNVDKEGNITQTQYRWAFVCVDALTKVAWIYPVEQLPNREAMQGTGQGRLKDTHSPQATQTMDSFQKFVHRINRTREQYWATQMDDWEAKVESKYLQNLEQSEVKDSLVGGAQPLEKPKELKPVLITHDNGAEFGGTKQEGGWQPNIRELRERYQGKYYKETITPVGRSQYNSIAERFIRTIRRYFHTRYQQHQQNKNKNKDLIKRNIDRRRVNKENLDYDWVADIDNVMIMYNSAYHSTIKTRPIDALLERGVTHAEIARRIRAGAKHRYRDAVTDKNLPGFSPSSPLKVGDLVRIKAFKGGGVAKLSFTRTNGKGSADNWSELVYKIIKVRKSNDPDFASALSYRVRLLNYDDKKKEKSFRGHMSFDRTQLLKIPEYDSDGKRYEYLPADQATMPPDVRKRLDEIQAKKEQQKKEAKEAERQEKLEKAATKSTLNYNVDDILSIDPSFFEGDRWYKEDTLSEYELDQVKRLKKYASYKKKPIAGKIKAGYFNQINKSRDGYYTIHFTPEENMRHKEFDVILTNLPAANKRINKEVRKGIDVSKLVKLSSKNDSRPQFLSTPEAKDLMVGLNVAETRKMEKTLEWLQANPGVENTIIKYQQDNPKTGASRQRYEKYKHAKTIGEFVKLGGWKDDFDWDQTKKFLTVYWLIDKIMETRDGRRGREAKVKWIGYKPTWIKESEVRNIVDIQANRYSS